VPCALYLACSVLFILLMVFGGSRLSASSSNYFRLQSARTQHLTLPSSFIVTGEAWGAQVRWFDHSPYSFCCQFHWILGAAHCCFDLFDFVRNCWLLRKWGPQPQVNWFDPPPPPLLFFCSRLCESLCSALRCSIYLNFFPSLIFLDAWLVADLSFRLGLFYVFVPD